MTSRGGTYVVLGFALVWLWLGVSGLTMPWPWILGVAGAIALMAVAWHVLRRPMLAERGRRFYRGRFGIAVAFELIAGNLAQLLLGRAGLIGYIWPVFGIIVALHFIGLWWASGDRRFLTLTTTMLAVNVVALFFAPAGAAMLAVSGLGSFASLLTTIARA